MVKHTVEYRDLPRVPGKTSNGKLVFTCPLCGNQAAMRNDGYNNIYQCDKTQRLTKKGFKDRVTHQRVGNRQGFFEISRFYVVREYKPIERVAEEYQ